MLKKIFRYLQEKKFFSRFYLDFKMLLKVRKPRLIIRLIKNYIAVIIFGKRPLRSIDFAPTYACNMNCEHCFAGPMRDDKKERLTPADYGKIADEAKRLGAIHFAFQGGEPLLLDDLEEMIRAIGPADSFVSITTNALLLTEERLLRLKKAGLDMITVSLDSGRPEEHDAFRKTPGAFEKALAAVKTARKLGLIVTVNTVVTRENLAGGGFAEIVNLCARFQVKLNILFPAIAGKWRGRKDLILTEREKEEVRKIAGDHTFVRRDLDANYVTYGCGAVKEMLYISPYGEVMPCSFIHVLLGKIGQDSLKSCIERGLRVPYFSAYYPVCPPMEDIGFIDTCLEKIAEAESLPAAFEAVFGRQ